jgi:hypothetical protein
MYIPYEHQASCCLHAARCACCALQSRGGWVDRLLPSAAGNGAAASAAAACCRLLPPAAFAAAVCRHQTDSDPVLLWQLQEEPPKPNNTAVWLLRNPQAHMFVRMFKVGAWV